MRSFTRTNALIIMFAASLLAAGLIALAPSSLPPLEISSPFVYRFSSTGTLQESGSMNKSTSPYWWLNSGGKLEIAGGSGSTIQGPLPIADRWRKAYASGNANDTDGGYYPQNLFRLVTKHTWHDFQQQAYFKIIADNLSDSSNRNASNGLLLFNRYQDGDNLYYTGLRVDGTAVIKKKIRGTYYTMAQEKVFAGTYHKTTNPNLLPKRQWIGIRSVVTTTNGTVNIKLYTDVGRTGTWTLAAHATDDGTRYGAVNDATAHAGIRTDFMDVAFDDYQITEL